MLRVSPYNLAWGSSIYAIVSAQNIYGTSIDSEAGNDAVILTVPDAPINLANVEVLTGATQIGMSWDEGFDNGGTSVIDYQIWTDQA